MIRVERNGQTFHADVQVVTPDRAIVSVIQQTGEESPVIVTQDVVVKAGQLRTLSQKVIEEVNRAVASVRPSLSSELAAITKAISEGLA